MKFLRITFSDGKMYRIPAEIIAKDRTEYYRGVDEREEPVRWSDEDYKKEFAISMEDDELIDWAFNNMNWEDIKPHAVFLGTKDAIVSYRQEWSSGEVDHEILTA
jgi:hypothetical protein